MSREIKFNHETYCAMMAVLRFREVVRLNPELVGEPQTLYAENHVAVVEALERWISKNSLPSKVIVKCGCSETDISVRETILNTCIYCGGPVEEDFLPHHAQHTRNKPKE